MCIPFLPFGPLTLKASKIKGFKERPETLGEHLKKRRLELGLLQREVAEDLSKEQTDRLLFLIPDELVQHLDEIAAQNTSSEQTVRGYKVKVNRKATKDAADRRSVVAKVVARSLKNIDKGKKPGKDS